MVKGVSFFLIPTNGLRLCSNNEGKALFRCVPSMERTFLSKKEYIMSKFINELNNNGSPDPENNVFADIWKQYERVVLHSLITSFGLDFLVRDQHGGDVDTVRGVRAGVYKNPDNAAAYEARGEYNSSAYHTDPRYVSKVKTAKDAYSADFTTVDDAYVPGRKLHFTTAASARNAGADVGTAGRANLDHVVAAKEIHDDAGRVLAGVDGVDLANSGYNLRFTNEQLNKSKRDDSVETVIARGVKGEPLPEEVADRMRQEDAQARAHMDENINRAYYSSARFLGDTAIAACQRGVEMGIRQAVGFYFLEVWIACEEELKGVNTHCEIGTLLQAIKRGIAKGSENALKNYKDLFRNFGEGFIAGAMASVTTTLINIFITTDKNTVRYIRQASASIVQAGNILLINPNNLLVGDQLKAATITLATGASVIAGTAVGSLIERTPIYSIPEVGQFVQTFCSVLVSGLLSCTLLIMLDRSKFVNRLVAEMNKYQDANRSYLMLAEDFARIAAELEGYDIRQFHIEVAQYRDITTRIEAAMDEEELESLMVSIYTTFDIDLPWGDDIDSFMSNPNNKLVFK